MSESGQADFPHGPAATGPPDLLVDRALRFKALLTKFADQTAPARAIGEHGPILRKRSGTPSTRRAREPLRASGSYGMQQEPVASYTNIIVRVASRTARAAAAIEYYCSRAGCCDGAFFSGIQDNSAAKRRDNNARAGTKVARKGRKTGLQSL